MVITIDDKAEISSNPIKHEWRGSILDRNGIEISKSEEISVNLAQRLINSQFSPSFSNIINNCASEKIGLDYEYDAILRFKNNNPNNENIGNSIMITCDSELQKNIYNIIFNFENNNYISDSDYIDDFIGSVVVMRQNGEILADISYPSFDYIKFKTGYSSKYVMKIQSSIAFKNQTLMNVPVHLSILQQMYKENNDIENLFKKLKFYDKNYLECDFGTLENSIKNNNNQPFIYISPIYLACLTEKIVMNQESITKPFMLYKIVDADDKEIIISDQTIIDSFKDYQEKEKWERILSEITQNRETTINYNDFNSNAFLYSKGNFELTLPEKYDFSGRVETELYSDFLAYGMILDKELPEKSFIVVIHNSSGIKDQDSLKELYQKIIDKIIEFL